MESKPGRLASKHSVLFEPEDELRFSIETESFYIIK
jgi:hypothetical protein